MPMQGHNSAASANHRIIQGLLDDARLIADFVEEGRCPSCGNLLIVVYDGSSGSESWCEGIGCSSSLHMDEYGDFWFADRAPEAWTGEDD